MKQQTMVSSNSDIIDKFAVAAMLFVLAALAYKTGRQHGASHK
jgi:hypothetical protein